MYDDTNDHLPITPAPASWPLALKIDDATIEKIAKLTGLKLPEFVNAALLNSTLQSLAEIAAVLAATPEVGGWWNRWGSQTFTIVFRAFLAATLAYLAAK